MGLRKLVPSPPHRRTGRAPSSGTQDDPSPLHPAVAADRPPSSVSLLCPWVNQSFHAGIRGMAPGRRPRCASRRSPPRPGNVPCSCPGGNGAWAIGTPQTSAFPTLTTIPARKESPSVRTRNRCLAGPSRGWGWTATADARHPRRATSSPRWCEPDGRPGVAGRPFTAQAATVVIALRRSPTRRRGRA